MTLWRSILKQQYSFFRIANHRDISATLVFFLKRLFKELLALILYFACWALPDLVHVTVGKYGG